VGLQVELVSPEEIAYTGEADVIIARTVGGGDIAFQAGHVPFIGTLAVWEVRLISGSEAITYAVHRGFVEVSGNTVIILSDMAERSDEIDVERARTAKAAAEQAVAANAEDADAAADLRRAVVRLHVSGAEPLVAH
jgi:F-type H+-transporting ATPase subunit epsilon